MARSHLGPAGLLKSAAQHDHSLELTRNQVVLDFLARSGDAHRRNRGSAERGQETVGLRRRLLDHHADRHPPQVERDAKAEDKQQHERQHSRDDKAARDRAGSAATPCGSSPRRAAAGRLPHSWRISSDSEAIVPPTWIPRMVLAVNLSPGWNTRAEREQAA